MQASEVRDPVFISSLPDPIHPFFSDRFFSIDRIAFSDSNVIFLEFCIFPIRTRLILERGTQHSQFVEV